MTKRLLVLILLFGLFATYCSKSAVDNQTKDGVKVCITNPGKTALLWQTSTTLLSTVDAQLPTIQVDINQKYQTVDGFGYTMTGGSAELLQSLPISEQNAVLKELFGTDETSIAVSYLRISLGASDLSSSVFSYDELPAGETDLELKKFSLAADTTALIPILKACLKINPKIKLMASPWSAPAWMKTNGSARGGSLQPKYYAVYAQYFVKYLQAMRDQGILIDAVTVQNEPMHDGNNPSMLMSALQQAEFVKLHLGPALAQAGLTTKIVIWDHNCDRPDYPISVLNDAMANPYVDGSAFHLYAGDISALSQVHDEFPLKNLYFTEQWTGANSSFGGDLSWHTKNVIIGSMRNWSRNALEWNLASDPFFQPHTPGGCSQCLGALTIGSSSIGRNVSYYIIAQASKFVPAGSVVVASNLEASLPNVAFLTPDQKKVLIVLNEASVSKKMNIIQDDRKITYTMSAGSVATFCWQ